MSTFVRLEEKSRDAVPMSDSVIAAIQESIVHGKPIRYAAQMEGYFIAVQRLAHYIIKVRSFKLKSCRCTGKSKQETFPAEKSPLLLICYRIKSKYLIG